MKNTVAIVIVLIAIIVAAFLVFNSQNKQNGNTALLADHAEFLVYSIAGQPTGSAFLSLEFTQANESMVANVFADLNGDGLFEKENELIVKNTRVNIKPDFPNRIAFSTGNANLAEKENLEIKVLLSPETIEISKNAVEEKIIIATIQKFDSNEQLGIGIEGASIELKRGTPFWPIEVKADDASTALEPVDIQLDDLPDLSGGPMDCFPIATANNLIYLSNKNGKRSDLPTNPQDIVNELKTDMKYNNGVLLNDFKAGKDAFVERYGLPIETTRIDRPSFDDIKNAIEGGGVVELSTGMTQSASGKANTGHVMAVAGVISDGGQVGFTASDPATPVGGTEIFELTPPPDGSAVWTFNYPLWDGITFIDAIFVQNWKKDDTAMIAPESNQMLTGSQIAFGEGTKDVEVLVINGKNYPKFQFHKSNPEGHNACGAEHWHASQKVVNLNEPYSPTTDPDPNACGFGKTGEVPEKIVSVTEEVATKFFGEYLIQNP